ncbi:hypothetical protein B0G81_6794 [Paraburkholderia sp. BL6665CI2N2]|nr:hypothetical protein B0G81_6794 [Paraburkholderia sp. BL6665CI2N2]
MGMLGAWMRDGGRVQMGAVHPARPDLVPDVLLDWYEVQDSYRPKLGFDRATRNSKDFRISRQWMEENDLDDDIDAQLRAGRAEVVEKCVASLELQFRVAIQTEMRNRLAGASVFANGRSSGQHETDFRAACALLKPMLAAHGLLD